jgi:hypothetical protein
LEKATAESAVELLRRLDNMSDPDETAVLQAMYEAYLDGERPSLASVARSRGWKAHDFDAVLKRLRRKGLSLRID